LTLFDTIPQTASSPQDELQALMNEVFDEFEMPTLLGFYTLNRMLPEESLANAFRPGMTVECIEAAWMDIPPHLLEFEALISQLNALYAADDAEIAAALADGSAEQLLREYLVLFTAIYVWQDQVIQDHLLPIVIDIAAAYARAYELDDILMAAYEAGDVTQEEWDAFFGEYYYIEELYDSFQRILSTGNWTAALAAIETIVDAMEAFLIELGLIEPPPNNGSNNGNGNGNNGGPEPTPPI